MGGGLLAGLGGGFGGASHFLELLSAMRERQQRAQEEQGRFDVSTGLQRQQMQQSADQFGQNFQQHQQEFDWRKQQDEETARRQAAQDLEHENQYNITTLANAGARAGVNYMDPRRAVMRSQGVEALAQPPAGGESDVLGALRQGAAQSARSSTTDLINRAGKTAAQGNLPGQMIDSPSGQIYVENHQFRPPDPNQRLSEQYRMDQLRQHMAGDVTAFNNSLKSQEQEIRQQVISSMPQIQQKYGRLLSSSDPTMQQQGMNGAMGEFGLQITHAITQEKEKRKQGFIRTLKYSYPDAQERDIYFMLYGHDDPNIHPSGVEHGMGGAAASGRDPTMDAMLRGLGINVDSIRAATGGGGRGGM